MNPASQTKHRTVSAENTVQLWRMDTPVDETVLRQLALTLCPDETRRAQAFAKPEHRSRFITRRGLLRFILAQHLQASPSQLLFTYGPQGKPLICLDAHRHSTIHFNLSHSNDLAILGVVRHSDIGVDVEAINPKRDIQGIGQRYFHPLEWDHIAAMPAHEQTAAFFDNWACKEAIVKARGGGIVSGLSNFIIQGVNAIAGDRQCLDIQLQQPTPSTPWTLRTMQLTDRKQQQFRAAVALPGEHWQLPDTLLDAAEAFNASLR